MSYDRDNNDFQQRADCDARDAHYLPPDYAIPAVPVPLEWLPGKPVAEGWYWLDFDTYPARIDREATGDLWLYRAYCQPVPLAETTCRFAGPLPGRPTI